MLNERVLDAHPGDAAAQQQVPAAMRAERLTLRTRIILLVSAVTLPLLILAGFTAWGMHRAERERAEAALVGLAHGTALLIDREFAAAELVLRALAASNALVRADLDNFEAEMRAVAEASGAQAINLIGPDGRVVRSTGLPPGRGTAVQARGPARDALATGRTAIGNLFISPLSHAGAVGIAVPVLVPGAPPGAPPAFVLGYLLQRQRLLATLTDQWLPQGSVAAVLDRERRIVARTRRDAETVGSALPGEVTAALQGGPTMVPFAYTSLDGTRVVAAYAQAPQTGYWAKLTVPADAFEAPLRAALMRTAAIGALLLGASILVGALLAARLAASLRQLADPLRATIVGGPPELSALAGTLRGQAARYESTVADLRTLFDRSPVGVVRWDAGGRVRDANDAFLSIVGMTQADLLVGRVRWDDLTPPEWIGRDEAAIAEAIRLGGCAPYQKEYVRPDGTRVPVLSFFAFTDAATGAAAAFVVDLSRWVSTEAALARAHEQMRLAIGAARMFFWDWDIASGRVEWSEGLEQACGLPPGGFGGTADAFRALMHPDDLPRVEAALGRSLAGEASYDTEFRMCRPDGSVRWVVARATVQRDGTGRPVRMIGIDFDVTDRKAAEAALLASEAQLRRVQSIGRIGGFEFDLRTGTSVRSPGYQQLHSLPAGTATDGHQEWLARLHPEDRERAEQCLLAAISDATRETTYAQEYRIVTADGAVHWIASRGEIERDAEGRGLRLIGAHLDVTDLTRAKQALADSEARLLLAQEAGGIGFWDWDLASGEANGSPAYHQIYGLPLNAPMPDYAGWLAHLHPEDRDRADATAKAGLAAGAYQDEFRILRPDGEVRWVTSSARVLRDAAGLPSRFLGVNVDITDRKISELSLQASEERLRSFAEASSDVIYILDIATQRLDFLSPAFEHIWGEPRATVLNDLGRWVAMLHPEDRAAAEATMQRLHDGEAVDSIYRIIRPSDGEVRHIRDAAVPIRDADGRIIRVAGLARDVSRRILTEQQLAQSEARLQRALDELRAIQGAVPVGLAVVDHDFRFRHINPALADINGLSVADHIGRSVAEVAPKLWSQLEPIYRAALDRGEATMDLPITSRIGESGEERHWRASYFPVRDAAEAIWGVGFVVQDVTERHHAAALAASEERFRSLAEFLPAFVFITGPDGETSYVNARMTKFVGRPVAALTGDGWATVLHPADRDAVVAAWREAVTTGAPFEGEYRFIRHDGVARWFLCRGVPECDAAGRIMRWVGTCTDIDDQRQAEQALGRAGASLNLAIASARLGSCVWDLRTHRIQASPRLCQLYGLPEVPVFSVDRVRDAIHPEDRLLVEAALTHALSGRADFSADHRVIMPDGGIRWLRSHGRVEFGPDGRALAMHGMVLDIDAEMQAAATLQMDNDWLEARVAERTHTLTLAAAELTSEMRRREEVQAALIEAQKLEALGQMTGGVAHDFNNVLAAIIGCLRLIERRAADNVQILEFARAGIGAADRATALIRQLMAFARREDRVALPWAPARMIPEVHDLLRSVVGAGIEVELEVEPGIWPVLVDLHRLEGALLNLGANARDAMEGSGTLRVTARNEPSSTKGERPAGLAKDGDCVVFVVQDTGHGMSPEVLARATEAFFTTKPRGQGTGLGLAMVRSFVQDASGAVRIISAPGEGTRIELWLPRAIDAVAAQSVPEDEEDPALHGQATVLVVDDDPAVRMMTVTLLRDLGYEVLEAGGVEAAMIQALAAARLDLVVSDLTMPGGGGLEFLARLRSERPGVAAIFVSGHASRYPLEAGTVLAKPFTPAELGSRVLRTLGRVSPRDRMLAKLRRPELREAYVRWRRQVDAASGVLPKPEAFGLEALSGAAYTYRVAIEGTDEHPAFRLLELGAGLVARTGTRLVGDMMHSEPDADEVLTGLASVYQRCARFGVPATISPAMAWARIPSRWCSNA